MQQRSRVPERLTLIIAVLASVTYLGTGIFLIVTTDSYWILPPPGVLRYGLAVLLIAYGAFRTFRAYQRFREEF
nr:hypothetical protein [uncultured Arsenicibacter sp.]